MSIIGTRPPLISETNFYELHHRARLAIKPGITGMWQVSGRSDITDFEEVVRLDKEYTYYMKRKERQTREVTELVHKYRECYGKEPDEKALHEFFWLFSDGDSQLTETWKRMMTLVGNEKESYDALRANKKKYENLDKFLKEI